MTVGTFTEDHLEHEALETLADLGWQPLPGSELTPLTGERASWSDPTLTRRLATALARLNPEVPTDYLDQAMAELLRPRSNDAITENFRLHEAMTTGYNELTYVDADGLQQTPVLRLISPDVDDNEWLAVNQIVVRDGEHHRRFDIGLYCNGLLVAVIELKRTGDATTGAKAAHAQLAGYLREFPMAFRSVVFTVSSDGIDSRYGSPFAGLAHYGPWNVDDDGRVVTPAEMRQQPWDGSLNLLLNGVANLERFLQLLRGFTAFAEEDGKLVKRIAMPHQYFAVTKAVGCTVEAVRGDGRIGVVWHTQGSGKSMEMELYAAAVHRVTELRNPTIVVVTDRTELDDQLYDTFAASKLLPESPVKIDKRAELRAALTGRRSGGIFFTTLQKFGRTRDERAAGVTDHPVLTDRSNVLVVVDEAHRSHYGDQDGFAHRLHTALPNAAFIAFTGTPINETDRDTRRVFGDYIDVYDLTRAVDDGATVPVLYEPRHITMTWDAGVDAEDFDRAADEATLDLDDVERHRVEAAVARINEIYGHPDRIRTLVTDLLAHWERRREDMLPMIESGGKALVVTSTREIAVRVYDEIIRQRRAVGDDTWHSENDTTGKVKVVISGKIQDPDHIAVHTRTENALKDVKKRVKDPEDELELVIVKDMMLVGFDAPSLHTLYIDRPLKGALLMQTLARVNRTYKGKSNGLMVGYAPITENLEAALAEYSDTDRTVKPQGRHIDEAVDLAVTLLGQLDALIPFDWRAAMAADPRPGAFIGVVRDAVNQLLAPENRRVADVPEGEEPEPSVLDRYRLLAANLQRAWSLAGGAETLAERRPDFLFHKEVRVHIAKYEAAERRAEGRPMPEDVERLLRSLLAANTSAGEVVDIYSAAGIERPNLAQLDPEVLRKVRDTPHPNMAIEALRAALTEEVRRVTGGNQARSRLFSERISEVMAKYLNSQLSAIEVIDELIAMAKEISQEARRGETFDPPLDRRQLATYDALATNESADLLMGKDTLARIARELVSVVRRDVTTDWTVREDVRAKLRSSIKRLLIKYDYPPDQQQEAIGRVIEQMELFAMDQKEEADV